MMHRNELGSLVVALMAGILVGVIYFRALWWTVRKGVHALKPARLFIGSFIARTLFALLAFYFIGRDHPERLTLCLVGFVLGRFLTVRFTRAASMKDQALTGASIHASEP
jgi:F1F0 ATPase subunit 2